MSLSFGQFEKNNSSLKIESEPMIQEVPPANGIHEVDLELDTLEEPVYETLWRDVKSIAIKISIVLIPRPSKLPELKNWDLWGPLFFCLSLAITLGFAAKQGQAALVFAGVFVLIWLGSAVVTINAQLLGSNLSFFQSLCILGYCVFPLVLCSFVFMFLSSWLIRIFIIPFGFLWSVLGSVAFVSGTVEIKKRLLVVFPITAFYLLISWLIFVQEAIAFK
jgi:hypothetical protein